MVAIIANEGFTHPVLSQIQYWKNIMKPRAIRGVTSHTMASVTRLPIFSTNQS